MKTIGLSIKGETETHCRECSHAAPGHFSDCLMPEVERLKLQVEKLMKALEPFSCVKPWECLNDEELLALNLPVKLFRNASTALASLPTLARDKGDL